jgi:transposase InsO family protein
MKWSDELADELHKPVRHHFPKRRVFVRGIDEIWAADLVDMQHYDKFNDGYKYLLTVIDVFSKYAWVRPLRSKSGNDVALAFKDIMDGTRTVPEVTVGGKRSPRLVWSDKGKEFYNKHVESLVTLYSTENEEKSCVVERFNRTLKGIMFKYFTANNTYRYVDGIQEMVDLYNNTKHRSIKMTPVEASNPEMSRKFI